VQAIEASKRKALFAPFRPRPVQFLEVWEEAGWRMKVYSICYNRQHPRPELVEAARRVVRQHLSATPADANAYGVGFVGIHDGRRKNFVFVGWWAEENELYQHLYVSPADQPGKLEYVTPSGLSACVFDLQLVWFERNAWVEKVLANPAGPDIDAYLKKRLSDQA
jgi:hypothetical protein